MRAFEDGDIEFAPITVRIAEACRITGIGRSKFYKLIAEGEIETIKVGSMALVPVEGLRQFLEKHRRPRKDANNDQ